MIKIGIIGYEYSDSTQCLAVEKGLKSILDKRLGSNNYKLISYDGPRDITALDIHIRDYIKNLRVNCLITFGLHTTRRAIKFTDQFNPSLPIISLGIL